MDRVQFGAGRSSNAGRKTRGHSSKLYNIMVYSSRDVLAIEWCTLCTHEHIYTSQWKVKGGWKPRTTHLCAKSSVRFIKHETFQRWQIARGGIFLRRMALFLSTTRAVSNPNSKIRNISGNFAVIWWRIRWEQAIFNRVLSAVSWFSDWPAATGRSRSNRLHARPKW